MLSRYVRSELGQNTRADCVYAAPQEEYVDIAEFDHLYAQLPDEVQSICEYTGGVVAGSAALHLAMGSPVTWHPDGYDIWVNIEKMTSTLLGGLFPRDVLGIIGEFIAWESSQLECALGPCPQPTDWYVEQWRRKTSPIAQWSHYGSCFSPKISPPRVWIAAHVFQHNIQVFTTSRTFPSSTSDAIRLMIEIGPSGTRATRSWATLADGCMGWILDQQHILPGTETRINRYRARLRTYRSHMSLVDPWWMDTGRLVAYELELMGFTTMQQRWIGGWCPLQQSTDAWDEFTREFIVSRYKSVEWVIDALWSAMRCFGGCRFFNPT